MLKYLIAECDSKVLKRSAGENVSDAHARALSSNDLPLQADNIHVFENLILKSATYIATSSIAHTVCAQY